MIANLSPPASAEEPRVYSNDHPRPRLITKEMDTNRHVLKKFTDSTR